MPEKKKYSDIQLQHKAKIKKQSGLEKFAASFFSTDATNLKDYILFDLAIPLIKSGISGLVNMVLYGNTGKFNQIGSPYVGKPNNVTSYTSYWSSQNRQEQQQVRQIRPSYNFQNIIFETRGDAEIILRELAKAIDIFGIVSVSDMYEMAKIPNDNYTLNDYGWTDIRGAEVVRYGGAYTINLPNPVLISGIK